MVQWENLKEELYCQLNILVSGYVILHKGFSEYIVMFALHSSLSMHVQYFYAMKVNNHLYSVDVSNELLQCSQSYNVKKA